MKVETAIKRCSYNTVLVVIKKNCEIVVSTPTLEEIQKNAANKQLPITFGVLLSKSSPAANPNPKDFVPVYFEHKAGETMIRIDTGLDSHRRALPNPPAEFWISLPENCTLFLIPD